MENQPPETLQDMLRRLSEGNVNMPEFTKAVAWLFEQPSMVGILVMLMLLDVLTGIIAARIANEIDSTVSYRGALKKSQMLLMVAAGMVFERLHPGFPWGKAIAFMMCLGEMFSIVENAGKSGVPLPQALIDTMKKLRAAEKAATLPTPEAKIVVDVHTTGEPGPPGPQGPPGEKGDSGVWKPGDLTGGKK